MLLRPTTTTPNISSIVFVMHGALVNSTARSLREIMFGPRVPAIQRPPPRTSDLMSHSHLVRVYVYIVPEMYSSLHHPLRSRVFFFTRRYNSLYASYSSLRLSDARRGRVAWSMPVRLCHTYICICILCTIYLSNKNRPGETDLMLFLRVGVHILYVYHACMYVYGGENITYVI